MTENCRLDNGQLQFYDTHNVIVPGATIDSTTMADIAAAIAAGDAGVQGNLAAHIGTVTAHSGQDLRTTATPSFAGVNLSILGNFMRLNMSGPHGGIGTGVFTVLHFDLVNYGTLGTLNPATWTWTAPTDGFYAHNIRISEQAPQNGVGDRSLGFFSTVLLPMDYSLTHHMAAVPGQPQSYDCAVYTFMNAGDTIRAILLQNSGVNAQVYGVWEIMRLAQTH